MMHLEYVQSFQHECNVADVVVIDGFIWYISGCQFKLMFLVALPAGRWVGQIFSSWHTLLYSHLDLPIHKTPDIFIYCNLITGNYVIDILTHVSVKRL